MPYSLVIEKLSKHFHRLDDVRSSSLSLKPSCNGSQERDTPFEIIDTIPTTLADVSSDDS